jgi:hypothetical protein
MVFQEKQKIICEELGSGFITPNLNSKIGIALTTLSQLPLDGLRHPPEKKTCGWNIWGSETFSKEPDFFQTLHVYHLEQYCLTSHSSLDGECF